MTTLTFHDVRCRTCDKLIIELVSAPWRARCSRCGTIMQCLVLAEQEVITDSLKPGWSPDS